MRPLAEAALYFHTVRHLRPEQVWGRLVFMLRRPTPDLRAAPPVAAAPDRWQSPAGRRPSMLGPWTFRFLNEEAALPPGASWELPGHSKLWLYNLHYFDDLNAVGSAQRAAWHLELVARWIAENPPGHGTGWEPYPTSLRIVNWIKWAWSCNDLDAVTRHSLAIQARWLVRRLETHLLGNHLFANAKALIFAGAYFEGAEARDWLQRGVSILEQQIPEQVLPDGGHVERSTMYHALVLEDMLDLVNLAQACPGLMLPAASPGDDWAAVARRMGRWLSVMCHPDGEIAFFNDAAFGIAPAPDALIAYARRLAVDWEDLRRNGVVWLEDSGYVRAQRNEFVLFADVAPIGPDYLPAHAHADTLTFELSVHGRRVVVNCGTSGYTPGAQRDLERSTAMHNTVEVEGRNSSDVWAAFRVARRARPHDVIVREAHDAVRIEAAHDGYRRPPGQVMHRRVWELRNDALEIIDHLDGGPAEAVSRIHLHPAVQPEPDGGAGAARWNTGALLWRTEGCESSIVASTWHPEFGASVPSNALALRFGGAGQPSSCRIVLKWQPSRE